MKQSRSSLNQAVEFHGHLGPYLVLGLLMGGYALKKTAARPHFGMSVKVYGASVRPKSCLIDGLQLSTGCTYGKGNIIKYAGKNISAKFSNKDTGRIITLRLQERILDKLACATTHQSAEKLARQVYRMKPQELFKIYFINKRRE